MASIETTNKWIRAGAGLGLAALVLTSGLACKHHDDSAPKDPVAKHKDPDDWAPDDSTRSYRRYADAQAANGVDMTLYARDFDGDQVNAFGRDKLDLVVRSLNDSGAQRTLYLNATGGDANGSANRRASVEQYLRDANVAPDAIAIKDGPRTDGSSTPAVEHLARMVKLESPGHGGESSSSNVGNSSGSSGGGSNRSQ